MKDDLLSTNHSQSRSITQRHTDVIRRSVTMEKIFNDTQCTVMHNLHILNLFYLNYCLLNLPLSLPLSLFLIIRWDKLQKDSDAHKARLQRALDQFKKVGTNV